MHRKLTTALACAAALTLASCGNSSDIIAGTSPAIASAVCDGDDGCESDMRQLSHKLDASDDADGDGIINREELDAALTRLDKEAEEKEAASAAAASSSAAAASKSAEAEREAAEREAAEREAAEREAAERKAAERAAAEREAANQQQQAPEPAPQQQAPAQPAPAQSGPPAMEWATLGPYGSLFTCEQARDVWPVDSHACYTGADGNAYFEGMRQAAQ